jgi:hypothetical protein
MEVFYVIIMIVITLALCGISGSLRDIADVLKKYDKESGR